MVWHLYTPTTICTYTIPISLLLERTLQHCWHKLFPTWISIIGDGGCFSFHCCMDVMRTWSLIRKALIKLPQWTVLSLTEGWPLALPQQSNTAMGLVDHISPQVMFTPSHAPFNHALINQGRESSFGLWNHCYARNYICNHIFSISLLNDSITDMGDYMLAPIVGSHVWFTGVFVVDMR